ncbi:SAF domain-containing protein [Paenibacillus alvei]|uniref:SAF domain-containing protein n=1 Tax=Paenibacillus alvei TaxID=44250 RepID=UPI0022831742|nr:SAF domain-containing protein [Paenibacillus alvei]
MNIEWNWRTITIVAGIAIVFIGTNVGQYFLIWGPKQEKLTASYNQEIATLQATIDRLGPMVGIWTIKDGVQGLYPGKEVAETDLELRQLPESLVNQSYVLDAESIIGKYYRIGLTPGTVLSKDMVMEDNLDDTTREYDVVANVMPIGLKVGDYVDFRIVYPLGEDYIVLTHKRVEAIHDKTIKFKMDEKEIHMYQASLIDYFLQKKNGSSLYLAKYVEPGIQKEATQYYAVPKNILAIMVADPNIISKINTDLNNSTRSMIDAGISRVSPEAGQDISSGRKEIEGKVDGGANHLKSEEKARKDAEELANPGGTAAATETAPAPAPTPTPSSSDTTPNNAPTEAPTLNIEKGVVE